jgi:putative membrane protein
MSPSSETILRTATFNPKVRTYIFLVILFYLIVSFIGWILIPFWLLGLGQWFSGRFFQTLRCQLSDRNLRFAKGFIVHVEKTIPLENIQDVAFIGGPLLRAFGLTMIRVETAGGGGAKHTSNMMSMIGIEDAEAFRDGILRQRERWLQQRRQDDTGEAVFSAMHRELMAIRALLEQSRS